MLRLPSPALAALAAAAVAVGATPSPVHAQDAPKPLTRLTMN